jgi:hypothetical protein
VHDGREPPKWCVVADRVGPCTHVEIGSCGAHRYVKVEADPKCGGSTRYFDDAGVLTGVVEITPNHENAADGAIYDPLRERIYGHIPDCELKVVESACVKPTQ